MRRKGEVLTQVSAEEKAESGSTAAAAPSASGGGKLVPMLTIVNLLATLGMVAVLFISFQREKKKTSVDDINPAAGEHSASTEKGKDAHGAPAAGGHGEASGKDKKGPAGDFGKMVNLDQFVVNLSTPGATTPKFVKVNVSLDLQSADVETEVTAKMPQVRNAIIDLFNSKRPTDLATVEGRDHLKEEIRDALNGFMVSGKVRGVFFTNFAFGS